MLCQRKGTSQVMHRKDNKDSSDKNDMCFIGFVFEFVLHLPSLAAIATVVPSRCRVRQCWPSPLS
jgi:hypothetical protein